MTSLDGYDDQYVKEPWTMNIDEHKAIYIYIYIYIYLCHIYVTILMTFCSVNVLYTIMICIQIKHLFLESDKCNIYESDINVNVVSLGFYCLRVVINFFIIFTVFEDCNVFYRKLHVKTMVVGHQMVYEGSHCGKIVNSLVSAKSMSMVLMFDELDKISATPKGEEIQNLLVHLTDSTQNSDFEDKYLAGIPLDLSQPLFVFSGNDINKIDKILLDRFTVVYLEGYGPKEKMEIAEKFL
jgi:ATPase family associated with various cellular activities (AAA)